MKMKKEKVIKSGQVALDALDAYPRIGKAASSDLAPIASADHLQVETFGSEAGNFFNCVQRASELLGAWINGLSPMINSRTIQNSSQSISKQRVRTSNRENHTAQSRRKGARSPAGP